MVPAYNEDMYFIAAILAVFVVLVSSEIWWRKRAMHGEFSRKFVHITVGSFVAFWPFFLSWNQIRLLSLAFLIVVSLSKYLHIFRTIHSVQRPTWGEIFFALAVGGVTLITQNKWIYMASLLQMSLADGLAAVVGVRYGQSNSYEVFKHPKSIIGSLTFLVISVLILVGFMHYAQVGLAVSAIAALAVGATLIENCGVGGLDNLLVPLAVAAALRLLTSSNFTG